MCRFDGGYHAQRAKGEGKEFETCGVTVIAKKKKREKREMLPKGDRILKEERTGQQFKKVKASKSKNRRGKQGPVGAGKKKRKGQNRSLEFQFGKKGGPAKKKAPLYKFRIGQTNARIGAGKPTRGEAGKPSARVRKVKRKDTFTESGNGQRFSKK